MDVSYVEINLFPNGRVRLRLSIRRVLRIDWSLDSPKLEKHEID